MGGVGRMINTTEDGRTDRGEEILAVMSSIPGFASRPATGIPNVEGQGSRSDGSSVGH